MAATAVAMAAVAALLIAAATRSATQSYTQALISRIGAGSDAARQIMPISEDVYQLESVSHAPAYYRDHAWVS